MNPVGFWPNEWFPAQQYHNRCDVCNARCQFVQSVNLKKQKTNKKCTILKICDTELQNETELQWNEWEWKKTKQKVWRKQPTRA